MISLSNSNFLQRQATAEAHLKKCVDDCIDDYVKEMENVIDGADVYVTENDLLQRHIKAKEDAVARVCSIQILSTFSHSMTSILMLLFLIFHSSRNGENLAA